jgi:hypothetical protein
VLGRVFCTFLLLLTGCFSVRPDTPTAGITPAPRRIANDTAAVRPTSTVTPVAFADSRAPAPEILQQAAEQRFAEVHSYCARLRRRESNEGRPKPEDLILFKERKVPFSVHFKWIGPEAQGREVVYVKGRFEDKLHILTAAGDVPFVPAGRRMALSRDSMLVKLANPNHDITDAGIGFNLRDVGILLAASKNPSNGVTVKTVGMVQRPEFPQPMAAIEIAIPVGRDPDLPRGGKRQIFYCPACKLPLLYLCFDELGREQNYNCYDRIQLDLKLDDDDFDPDKLWGKRVEPSTAKKPE